ncbi:hypothetical protein GOARA_061_00580 [Gordonia araii NBRC 100433]|uniref:Clumping factor B n=1 Tax=Gordonia araii NBRC 100433 TaxID=1073574 RepID=G7H444_9ACTN|nr:DUF485 domain-containing protein [Gordonia araii]NNG96316.1 DUF485 domain-containing protein [Gordonia araii NBRC 100433]GAB10619.1 hypothetical protein GOARA_061_00580 [Gordonia araii NBRC 100433]
MSDPDDQPERLTPSDDEFLAAAASPEFETLRRTLRRFVFPMTVFFLVWYTTYVLLGAFAHDFMATPVWGRINVGLILGLLQFVTTFAITAAYIRFADRKLDPAAEAVRKRFADGDFQAGAAR